MELQFTLKPECDRQQKTIQQSNVIICVILPANM